MPSPITLEQTVTALLALGITPQALADIMTAPFPRALELMKELKEQARKDFKRLVFDLHPDRTGGDPVKTEQFRRLNEQFRIVSALTVGPPAPMPVLRGGLPHPPQGSAWVRVTNMKGPPPSVPTAVRGLRADVVSSMRPR